jgi:hypothetical protein
MTYCPAPLHRDFVWPSDRVSPLQVAPGRELRFTEIPPDCDVANWWLQVPVGRDTPAWCAYLTAEELGLDGPKLVLAVTP